MDERRARELLAPVLESWERGDFSTWGECFSDDLLVTGFDADGPNEARGPERIAAYLRRFFEQFRDYRIELGRFEQVSDDAFLLEGRQFGTGRSSGVEIAESLHIVFRFAAGKLAAMHWHPSRDGALAAAGLLENDQPAGR